MHELPAPPTPSTAPPPARASWVLPVLAMIGNYVAAAVVIGLGVRYDDRQQTPGLMVWAGVLMILPTWMGVALVRWWIRSREASALRLAGELNALARKHGGVTGVIDVVEPMLPPASTTQIRRDDAGDR